MTRHLSMSMFASKEDLQAARISQLEADNAALMEVVRGACCRKMDGERKLIDAIGALPDHIRQRI